MAEFLTKRIDAWELRRLFNDGKFWERAEAGEFAQKVTRSGHPAPPLANEPFCTQSQSLTYFDANGNKVAKVPQYLRPDGTIGLSGKPDPKRLLIGDTIYLLIQKK
ncbi:MAG: hypothetical protein L0387_20560 [Acidobacteria bacterium]|nr:hypothetical protein [Acidobacteriota bacterium]MCI0719917.1 hypothetical protein [Acidobacteriota bacterium]